MGATPRSGALAPESPPPPLSAGASAAPSAIDPLTPALECGGKAFRVASASPRSCWGNAHVRRRSK